MWKQEVVLDQRGVGGVAREMCWGRSLSEGFGGYRCGEGWVEVAPVVVLLFLGDWELRFVSLRCAPGPVIPFPRPFRGPRPGRRKPEPSPVCSPERGPGLLAF